MPANQHRLPRFATDGGISWLWWRKLSKRQRTISAASAAAALFIILLTLSPISVSRKVSNKIRILAELLSGYLSRLHPKRMENPRVIISLFLFAVCLDGSVPGYHLRRGFGSGSDSWLLHVEGGGWCSSISSCAARKRTKLGSSTHMEREVQFSGILSHVRLENPDFFNWNKVKIRYCDGSSFSSHPDSELKNGTKMFFRGQLIWDTLMDDLLSIGMSKSKEDALLVGWPHSYTVMTFGTFCQKCKLKCLADAGFFLNEKDIAGNHTIESFYYDVVHLQGVAKSLNHVCVARSEPSKCFFPQEFIRNIKTPLFLVQPAYDYWQISNILVPDSSDPHGSWLRCKLNIFNCDSKQLEVLHGYRNSLLKTLREVQKKLKMGVFINSCFVHCQTWAAVTWHSPLLPESTTKHLQKQLEIGT